MSAAKNKSAEPVIIVVKKVKGHAAHHGGAWKVAYADFVTAMMALFIVLWLLSASDQVKKAVGGYFQDPSGNGRLVGSTQAGNGEAIEAKLDELTQLKERIEKAMAREMRDFEKLKDYVNISVTEEGLRIELLEDSTGVFFTSGSASPSPLGADLFGKLAEQVGALPNLVVVEGHTDAQPFAREDGYSNWELSADRANTARRLMQQHGLRADQVEQVRGYADQHLRKKDAPTDPSNRRISILVRRMEVVHKESTTPGSKDEKTAASAAPAPGTEHPSEQAAAHH
ncbi:MAG: flagellar motor protein MotB [Acidobacteriota bacterium]